MRCGGAGRSAYASSGPAAPVTSSEMLLDDSRRVHAKVRAAGGVSRLEVFDHAFHVWQLMDGIVPAARVALSQAAHFLSPDGTV